MTASSGFPVASIRALSARLGNAQAPVDSEHPFVDLHEVGVDEQPGLAGGVGEYGWTHASVPPGLR